MILRAKDIKRDTKEQVDACVIGSGCGGASFAKKLAEYGKKVVILEQGKYYLPEEFSQWESTMYKTLYDNAARTGPPDLSSHILYGKILGGSSVHYMGNAFRAPERKLEIWKKQYGIPEVERKELDPYYDELERLHHVHSSTESEINENNRLLMVGCERLGWKAEPTRHVRKNCAGSGTCLIGCPFRVKQSQDLTHLPMAVSLGARIYTECRAEELVIEKGRVAGVRAAILDEQTGRKKLSLDVKAKIVTLAMGGVGTPAFLLKNRLCNSSGQVGKNFFVTPHFFILGEFNRDIIGWSGVPCSVVVHQFEEINEKGEGGYMIQGVFSQPAMAATLLPGFGREHYAMMKLLKKAGSFLSLLDDEEPGQIKVSSKGDVVIDYKIRGRDIAKVRDFLKKSSLIMLAAGAQQVFVPDIKRTIVRTEKELRKIDEMAIAANTIPFVGTSNLGTCRMGEDPKSCVVNPFGETFDMRGLFITDASVFPTPISVDPSLTIMANSYRVADHLNRNFGNYE